MSGPRQGQRGLHRFLVANLAHQNHVGGGAHRAAQRPGEGFRVETHFALVDDGLLIRVQEFDRILDREDVVRGGLVAVVDHRRQGRRLAGAGGADHEDEPALQHHEVLEDVGHAEILELGHLGSDVAQHHRGIAALIEHIDAEAAEARLGDREIDLQLLVEMLDLFRGHQAERRLAHGLGTQDLLVDGKDLAFDLDLDRRIARKEEIRRLALDHQLE